MGGREDATNVLMQPAASWRCTISRSYSRSGFQPKSSHGLQACAISSIDMDHEKFLGPTREDIASHKAYY